MATRPFSASQHAVFATSSVNPNQITVRCSVCYNFHHRTHRLIVCALHKLENLRFPACYTTKIQIYNWLTERYIHTTDQEFTQSMLEDDQKIYWDPLEYYLDLAEEEEMDLRVLDEGWEMEEDAAHEDEDYDGDYEMQTDSENEYETSENH
jgi:hypothetical protein